MRPARVQSTLSQITGRIFLGDTHFNDFDVLVVGGGINGCGIARDLAGRGYKVVLCEKDDLASHTSSSSTKLIHGGLRYLEYYEFSLVRKALQERETLLKSAPHIMWPLRFVMPHDPSMRPAWMIRIGLFMYDHLAKREVLPGSRTVDLRRHAAGAPLKAMFKRGFVYSDGWVDDARLVTLNALDARGARIVTADLDVGGADERELLLVRDRKNDSLVRVLEDVRVLVFEEPLDHDMTAFDQAQMPGRQRFAPGRMRDAA